jgi:hypothetical protein
MDNDELAFAKFNTLKNPPRRLKVRHEEVDPTPNTSDNEA